MHDTLMTIAWTIIGFVDPVIVYLDAATHNIGKVKGHKSFLNLSAAEWGSVTAMLGLPPLILYLWVREKSPADTRRKTAAANTVRRLNVVLILVSIRFWMICLLANYRAVLSIP